MRIHHLLIPCLALIPFLGFGQPGALHYKFDLFPHASFSTGGPYTFSMEERVPVLGSALQFRLEYEFGGPFAMEFGLGYAGSGFREERELRFGSGSNPNGGVDPNAETGLLWITYYQHALEVPVAVKAYIGQGATRGYLNLGMSAKIALARNARQRVREPGAEVRDTDVLEPIDWKLQPFSSFLGVGIQFATGETTSVYLEPRAQLSFLQGNDGVEDVNTTLVGAGLGMGFTW